MMALTFTRRNADKKNEIEREKKRKKERCEISLDE